MPDGRTHTQIQHFPQSAWRKAMNRIRFHFVVERTNVVEVAVPHEATHHERAQARVAQHGLHRRGRRAHTRFAHDIGEALRNALRQMRRKIVGEVVQPQNGKIFAAGCLYHVRIVQARPDDDQAGAVELIRALQVLANVELIKTMYACYQTLPEDISIIHVKGHAGVEGNEIADRMCFVAMQNKVEDFEEYLGSESIDELLAINAD